MPRIDDLLADLLTKDGTALHVAAGAPPLGRVRGQLVALAPTALEPAALEGALLELLSPAERARLEADLALSWSYALEPAASFQAAYFRDASGLGATFRRLPARAPSLADLGSPEVLWRLADRRSGLLLVAGPHGSGKSTTLAAMVDHINKTRACHIVTIESPIEVVHEPLRAHVTQREIGPHASSVADALRTAARASPDVVFASELREADETRLALGLARAGVLVLAAVRASDVVSAIERVVGAFAPDEQPQVRGALAEALVGVVAQQLVPTASGADRAVVHEILVGTPAAAARIREGKAVELAELMRAGHDQGMQTMDSALERLLAQGRISVDEALGRAVDREDLARVVARARLESAETAT